MFIVETSEDRSKKNKNCCLLITPLKGTTHFVLYSTLILLCISFCSLVLFFPLTGMQPCWHEAISLPNSSNCNDYRSVPPCPVSQFLFLKVCHHFACHHIYSNFLFGSPCYRWAIINIRVNIFLL